MPYAAVSMNDFGRTICCMGPINIPPKVEIFCTATCHGYAPHDDRRTGGILRGCLIATNLLVLVFVLVARYLDRIPRSVYTIKIRSREWKLVRIKGKEPIEFHDGRSGGVASAR